ncbi:hypothetical protein [Staphylococcus felis]|uniref:hypothetical protein n=1 Tax=Staphylococcus felis TaxID=46127 RepID=UPI0039678ED7
MTTTLLLILISVFTLILILFIIRIKYYHNRLDVAKYTHSQLINKISRIQHEHQLTSPNHPNDHPEYHFNLRKVKQQLIDILDAYKLDSDLKEYHIIATSQIAKKNSLYAYIHYFDYIIVTNIGIVLIDIKTLKNKTFLHFNGGRSFKTEDDVDKTIAQYLANRYHAQFNTNMTTPYTFSEKVTQNGIQFQFDKYDPWMISKKSITYLNDYFESSLDIAMTTKSYIYCIQENTRLIVGDVQSDENVSICRNKDALNTAIHHLIKTSRSNFSSQNITYIVNSFLKHE